MNTMDGYSCKPKWRNPFALLKLAGRTVAIVLLISHVLLANSMAFAGKLRNNIFNALLLFIDLDS